MLIEKFTVPLDELTDVGLKAIEMPKIRAFCGFNRKKWRW
jgi:hypothetical protein